MARADRAGVRPGDADDRRQRAAEAVGVDRSRRDGGWPLMRAAATRRDAIRNPQRPACCSRTSSKPGGGVLRLSRRRRAAAVRRGRPRRPARSPARPRGSRRRRPADPPCRWPARAPPAPRRRTRRGPPRVPRSDFSRASRPASSCSRDADRPRAPLVLDARARQLRFAGRPGDARRLERLLRAAQPFGGGGAVGVDALASIRTSSASTCSFDSVSSTRSRAVAACSSEWRSAVADLIAENTSLRAASTSASSPSISRCAASYASDSAVERAGRAIAFARQPRPRASGAQQQRPGPARGALRARSISAAIASARTRSASICSRVERDLLLQAVDVELARMRRLARRGGAGLRFGQLDAQAAEVGLDLGDTRRGQRLRARARRPGAPAPTR